MLSEYEHEAKHLLIKIDYHFSFIYLFTFILFLGLFVLYFFFFFLIILSPSHILYDLSTVSAAGDVKDYFGRLICFLWNPSWDLMCIIIHLS